ncbi:hypothetical protein Pint_05668 [Pistacia integerrima]|uniref:Uncharacterized protein n=1 Tax=Pistacia integerrima TaxID=434235 RepID=A0ACC0Z9S9_9ROSI|nr:hypothetical protein Pint_05668 [Pistacia integerrima]
MEKKAFNNYAAGLSDANHGLADHEGSTEKTGGGQGESFSSNEVLKKLRRYGISGILSYGLLNTAYYLTTFLLVWFYVAPAPGRMGYIAAVERFIKVMAMVWAGSQVTKLVRAGGALALAPFVDKGLSWFTVKFKFESQGKASFHGDCWILFWSGSHTIFLCDIAFGMKQTTISLDFVFAWRESS